MEEYLKEFLNNEEIKYITEVAKTLPQKSIQYIRETEKVGRNSPCTCGSGKKYKKCCGK